MAANWNSVREFPKQCATVFPALRFDGGLTVAKVVHRARTFIQMGVPRNPKARRIWFSRNRSYEK